MSSIKLSPNASGTGEFTIAAPNSNTNRTLTLPDQTGTVVTTSADALNIGSGQLVKDASGNVGIGTSSPATNSKLDIQVGSSTSNYGLQVRSFDAGSGDGTTTAKVYRAVNSTNGNWANAQYDAWRHIWTKDGTTEFMRIDSSGNLLVNTTSQNDSGQFSLTVASGRNGIGISVGSTAETGQIIFRNPNGVVGRVYTTNSTTTYATSSDYRLKEDVQPMTGALAKVSALKPCTYKWKVDGTDGQGFIAHELQEIVPECVSGQKDAVDAEGNPVYQGIDTSFLVATLTAALQELNAKVEAQAAEIAALKGAK